jgi:hypothetical protein
MLYFTNDFVNEVFSSCIKKLSSSSSLLLFISLSRASLLSIIKLPCPRCAALGTLFQLKNNEDLLDTNIYLPDVPGSSSDAVTFIGLRLLAAVFAVPGRTKGLLKK